MNFVITGASRGIGRSLAERALQEENAVVVVARDGSALEELARRDDLLGRAIPLAADLREEVSVLAGRIADELDRVDVLVNNAGTLIMRPFAELTADDLQHSLAVNLYAPALLTRALLPLLRRSERAHVVNITSMAGIQGATKFGGMAAYAASKGALNILTEVMAVELEEFGIRVNALAPGATDTDMLREAFPGVQAPVSASAMADWIYTFATEAWKVMNGRVIPVALTSP